MHKLSPPHAEITVEHSPVTASQYALPLGTIFLTDQTAGLILSL